jgi:hypothetical protein
VCTRVHSRASVGSIPASVDEDLEAAADGIPEAAGGPKFLDPVAKQRVEFESGVAGERVGIDGQPRLAGAREDVAEVQVAVQQRPRAGVAVSSRARSPVRVTIRLGMASQACAPRELASHPLVQSRDRRRRRHV